jgi:hypothetical protein
MEKLQYIVIMLLGICVSSCIYTSQNLNEEGKDKFQALEITAVPKGLLHFDTTYVAIYSDIYSENKDTRFNLTATLSLRNTSLKHSIYITAVDYYDTWGENIKSYLVTPVKLKPMQSVEYVIDEKDTEGGTGANFVIYWSSESTLVEPIFEGIMISTNGQQGISFSTKGISISNK